ncbi:MAG: DUF3037 domain-containing protein [Chloroflexales bacterium]|nr:DUF3037 domain-containing protein [Chloroflexales bacterium]
MPASAFEYALIRVVPRVERGEFVNVGALLLCRQRRFLQARLRLNGDLLRAMAPALDLEAVAEQLDLIPLVCAGGRGAGPIGALPLYERFRWLTAPRSTIIQPSPVHVGLCDDPTAALERVFRQMVG